MRLYRDSMAGTWGTPDGGFDAAMSLSEDLYNQTSPTPQWQDQYRVKTGSAPSDADAATDDLTPPPDVRVSCRPQKRTKQATDQAEKLIRTGRGFLNAWRDRRDPYPIVAQDMVLRGVGITRTLWDPRRAPQDPEDWGEMTPQQRWGRWQAGRVPVIMERRNPRTTRFLCDDEGDAEVVVEDYWTRVIDARRLWETRFPSTVARILGTRNPDDL